MRAVVMPHPGPPEVLTLVEMPQPEPTDPYAVVVHLHAAGVNPIDTKLRANGSYYPERLPTILGCDGAGEVVAVGSAVSRFQIGDFIFFCHGGIGADAGCYAEYTVVDEAFAAHLPDSLDAIHAAALPLVLITAWEALYDRTTLKPGQRLLIHAGAGGVGHIAIQLAKLADCQVITTVSSEAAAHFCHQLGADATINYRQQDVAAAVAQWSGGEGVDTLLDTVGGELLEQSFALVRPYGDIVTLLQPVATTNWQVARLRNLRISQELMLSPQYQGWRQAQIHQREILERGAALYDAGKLRVEVSETRPLAEAAAAHRRLEQGGMRGKLVLIP